MVKLSTLREMHSPRQIVIGLKDHIILVYMVQLISFLKNKSNLRARIMHGFAWYIDRLIASIVQSDPKTA
jgi:hypothetical protein